MKKFLTSIFILMFFIVSCGGSKKADNDADILTDEDANDEAAVASDEDNDYIILLNHF